MELVMSSIALTQSRPSTRSSRRFAGRFRFLLATLWLALQVRRERRALLALDDATLKDLGFNRSDAYAEAQRSFWDVPADRLWV
jgi:uncharacterized protein YjiS (DUF1127 family)